MGRRQALLLLALILPFTAGCGSNIAEVRVKIVFEGKPVTGGSVVFSPEAPEDQLEAGRSATGAADDNGEVLLTTYKRNDGALVGRHKVSYRPPLPPSASDPVLRDKQLKLFEKFGSCKLPEGHVVEIKSGKNEVTLELVRGTPLVIIDD